MDRIALKQNLDQIKPHFTDLENVLNIAKLNSQIESLMKQTEDASFWQDQAKAKAIFQQLNDLKSKKEMYESLKSYLDNLDLIYELSIEDPDSLNESDEILSSYESLYHTLETELLLNEEQDKLNCILEIHSGAGGTESLDWSEMLFRMYKMFAIKHKFKMTILDFQEGEEVGIKSVSILIEGLYAYGYLKSESGVHRLVRLSPFDSDHARHTTFASVLVTPEITDEINIELNEQDLRIDVFHSSGAGGQSVNTTDSAVRITHIPTKIVITCQNERSQIQNKETALKVLKSRLYQIELEKRKAEIDKLNNKSQISFGSQIRSYVFHPYTLVKDHRTQYETSQGDKVMNGELDDFINAYLRWYKGDNND